jgi:hypothetical protein
MGFCVALRGYLALGVRKPLPVSAGSFGISHGFVTDGGSTDFDFRCVALTFVASGEGVFVAGRFATGAKGFVIPGSGPGTFSSAALSLASRC